MSEIESTAEHFETAEILGAFELGFSGADRLRALLHFGGGCPVCAVALAGLAERARRTGRPLRGTGNTGNSWPEPSNAGSSNSGERQSLSST